MTGGDAAPGRLRVTVDGAEPLAFDLMPSTGADREADAAARAEVIIEAVRDAEAGVRSEVTADVGVRSEVTADVAQGVVPDPVAHVRRLLGPLSSSGDPARYEAVVEGWRFVVEVESAARAELRERASRAAQRGLGSGRQVVRAQIPGRIVALAVAEGEVVEAGQRLLSVEAMKMENAVMAPWAGTIARIGVVAGQTVELGDELVVIE